MSLTERDDAIRHHKDHLPSIPGSSLQIIGCCHDGIIEVGAIYYRHQLGKAGQYDGHEVNLTDRFHELILLKGKILKFLCYGKEFVECHLIKTTKGFN